MKKKFRIESDSLGEKKIDNQKLWGAANSTIIRKF